MQAIVKSSAEPLNQANNPPLNAPFNEPLVIKMETLEGEPKLLGGREESRDLWDIRNCLTVLKLPYAEICGSRDLWDIRNCLTVLKLPYESEAHKYRDGGWSGVSLLGKEEAVKLRAVPCCTWWAFAHTLVTSQFVLGRRDYP